MYIINEFQFIQMHIHALHLLNWKRNIPEISLWKLLQVKGFICKWGYMQVTLSWKHLPFIEKKYTCSNIIHQLYADNTPPSRFAVLFVYQRFLFIYTYLAIRFIAFFFPSTFHWISSKIVESTKNTTYVLCITLCAYLQVWAISWHGGTSPAFFHWTACSPWVLK